MDVTSLPLHDPDALVLVYTTLPAETDACAFATGVVESKLAGCVNVYPGVTSVYAWEGKVETSSEVAVLIKTRGHHREALLAYLARHHPYQTPVLLTFSPASVNGAYAAWMKTVTGI
jgi:periplasmic divalent cation tolerance protein